MRICRSTKETASKGKPGAGIGTTDPAPSKVPSRKGTSSVGQSTIRFWDLPHIGEAIGWKTMREERKRMRKRITLLIAALMMALTMALTTAVPAFAVKGDNPGTTVSGPSAGGSGDPPGTCTERQGQGGGGGAVTDTTKGSCNKLD